jgi:hypothetical protein
MVRGARDRWGVVHAGGLSGEIAGNILKKAMKRNFRCSSEPAAGPQQRHGPREQLRARGRHSAGAGLPAGPRLSARPVSQERAELNAPQQLQQLVSSFRSSLMINSSLLPVSVATSKFRSYNNAYSDSAR